MEKVFVSRGVYYVLIPEADLRVLCGCPPDVTKHLMKRGIITQKVWDKGLYETGPNALLLSDVSVQGGKLSNLGEFPILQMFYNQGMIIPNHPGNKGTKPLIIGTKSQVKALQEYLFRGTYGLANEEEVRASGVDKERAQEVIRIKLAFAFGKIRRSEELLDSVILEQDPVQLAPGLTLWREKTNIFYFDYNGQTLEVNLNLEEGETYDSPVSLDFHKVNREYFSVIHIGEGNGWDTERPCMSSIVTFQGKLYLIDTGPNIIDSLTALGISVNEIEGIFHSHAHDDHFAGLTSMIRSDHRIKYYATPYVRNGVMKKLSAITGMDASRFEQIFDVRDLVSEEWNDIEGLEVKPLFSLHPVETTLFFFRTLWAGGYKTYNHLADIASDLVMRSLLIDAPNATDYSKALYTEMAQDLRTPADVKKIDIGGGMIHGEAKDFKGDKSKKIILAHVNRSLTTAEKEIGSNASFGQEDILIPAQQDYVRKAAAKYLHRYFPSARSSELQMLLNCSSRLFNPGYIIQKKGQVPTHVYLVITGVAELIQADLKLEYMLSAGTLIGELDALGGDSTRFTYRTRSYVNVLEIPAELYRPFIQRNANLERIRQIASDMLLLQSTQLFGEMVSSPVLHQVAAQTSRRHLKAGEVLSTFDEGLLWMVEEGMAALFLENKEIEKLSVGEFFGEHSHNPRVPQGKVRVLFTEETQVLTVPLGLLDKIPILEWKMLELCDRRLRICKGK